MKGVITLLAIWCSSMNVAISHVHQFSNLSADSSEIIADKGNEPMTEKAARMHAALAGKWENTLYPFDENGSMIVEDAFLSYNFRKDGTYVKTLGGSQKRFEVHGRWEVSADGAQIFLYDSAEAAPETICIKYVQADELVLELALKCAEPGFCTKQKSFYFNRGA